MQSKVHCTVSCRDQKGFQTKGDFFPFMIFWKYLLKRLHGCDIRLQCAPCLIDQFLFSQEHGYYKQIHRIQFDQKHDMRSVLTFHSYKCVFHIMGAYKVRQSIDLVWTWWTSWRTPEKYLLCMSKESCWQTCLFNLKN